MDALAGTAARLLLDAARSNPAGRCHFSETRGAACVVRPARPRHVLPQSPHAELFVAAAGGCRWSPRAALLATAERRWSPRVALFVVAGWSRCWVGGFVDISVRLGGVVAGGVGVSSQ